MGNVFTRYSLYLIMICIVSCPHNYGMEPLTLRGVLKGHGNWITDLAQSENPEGVLEGASYLCDASHWNEMDKDMIDVRKRFDEERRSRRKSYPPSKTKKTDL